MLINFDKLCNSSRIWIFASENKLETSQIEYIDSNLSEFLNAWKSHQNELISSLKILDDFFIVIGVDENINLASGCSIDSLFKQISDIEVELSISLLKRTNIYCIVNNKIKLFNLLNIKKNVNQNTLFYDLTIQNKIDLKNIIKPIYKGWCKNLLEN